MVCVDGLWLGTWARFIAGNRLAPFVPTPPEVCRRLLQLGRLRPGERLVDLGCGDGRLLLSAVDDFGAAGATGYELNSALVRIARKAATAKGMSGHAVGGGGFSAAPRVVVHEADARQAAADGSLATADLVTLFLSTQGNRALLPMLRKGLRPEARVVSFHWEMPPEIQPSEVVRMPKTGAAVYLYENVGDGDWAASLRA
jgi:SAM-dependent methyltransferase